MAKYWHDLKTANVFDQFIYLIAVLRVRLHGTVAKIQAQFTDGAGFQSIQHQTIPQKYLE